MWVHVEAIKNKQNKEYTFYKGTRGPWTATPALIKVEEREQNKKNICFFKKTWNN